MSRPVARPFVLKLALIASLTSAALWACGGDDFGSKAATGKGGQAGHGTGGSLGGSAGSSGASHGGAAGKAGAPQGGAAGHAGTVQGGAAGNAGAPQGGAAGADAGCVEGQQCAPATGWSTCAQTSVTTCTGTQTRTISMCTKGACVTSDESQPCNMPTDTKCGDPWCCGPGLPNYGPCGGRCGSMHYKKICNASGVCEDRCEYVACWSDGCGAGTVTTANCP